MSNQSADIHGVSSMNTRYTDVVIVGAGPSGIFTALGMLAAGSSANIVIVLAMPSIRAIPRASRWNEVEL